MKMPPIHELHERASRQPTRTLERQEPAKPITREFERPRDLEGPDLGPSRGKRPLVKIDDAPPNPVYGE